MALTSVMFVLVKLILVHANLFDALLLECQVALQDLCKAQCPRMFCKYVFTSPF